MNDNVENKITWEDILTPAAKTKSKPRKKKLPADPNQEMRMSHFGHSHPVLPATDWKEYEGEGVKYWVHKTEDPMFHVYNMKCVFTGLYFKKADAVPVFNPDGDCKYTSTAYVHNHADQVFFCTQTNMVYRLQHTILVAEAWDATGITKRKRVSTAACNEYYRACAVTGDQFPRSQMVQIKSHSGGPTKYAAKPFVYSVAQKCPACDNHYMNGNGWFPHGDYSKPICAMCNTLHQKKNLIHSHNYSRYPSPIMAYPTRLGCTYCDDGFVVSTMKPELNRNIRGFGVEVEVELNMEKLQRVNKNRFNVAESLLKTLGKDFVMIKEDGSLVTNGKYSDGPGTSGGQFAGFEIVSAPADFATHNERWEKMERDPFYKLLRAWDTSTCGFHVHVGKEALSNLQIGRMLYFINHPKNLSFIQKVAGRSKQTYTKYWAKNFSDALHPDRVYNPDSDTTHNRQRRVALNISNPKTVEFRIFRGTINYQHIMRNIEFCDAVCEFCLPASRGLSEYSSHKAFVAFCSSNRKRWPRLAAWFALHGIINLPKIKRPDKANLEKLTINTSEVEEASIADIDSF